jgi:NADPH:quinone reductase-like Zn-dependent oxidoreductase
LIQVLAAGVTPTEKLWFTTTHHADGTPRTNAIPGHEFSGVVTALGGPTAGYRIGDAVYGFNDWFTEGATAEFCITEPSKLSLKPASLSPLGLLQQYGLNAPGRP